MNLYPKNINMKKSNIFIWSLLLASISIEAFLVFLNYITSTHLHWSLLCGVGIVYIWITVLYAIRKNINIAFHIWLQMICTSLLVLAIDEILGFKGWSLTIAMPIIAIVANVTMFILTIAARKRYGKYVVYHMLIFISTLISLLFPPYSIFIWTSLGVAVISFLTTSILCGRELRTETKRRFHF